MDILFATDDNYAWLAGISMLSLLYNNAGNHRIFIMDDGISDDNKRKLLTIAKEYCAELQFIDVRTGLNQLVEFGVTGYKATDNGNITAYSRLLASALLPDCVESVLYLDCDTLVIGEIKSIIDNLNFHKPMAMCEDCFINDYKKVIDVPQERKYYNSGVMLINLKKWIEMHCTELFLDHVKNIRASYPLVDQDIINVSLYEYIQPFEENTMNCLSQLFLYDYEQYKWVYKLDKTNWISKERFNKTISCPRILHFCGQTFGRPWFSNSCHPYKDEWIKYYQMSPWRDRSLENVELGLPYRIQLLLYKYMPKSVAAFVGGIMQRIFVKINY